MRIGHYSPWLLSPGGINSYLRRVVEAQINQGHQILILTGQTSCHLPPLVHLAPASCRRMTIRNCLLWPDSTCSMSCIFTPISSRIPNHQMVHRSSEPCMGTNHTVLADGDICDFPST